MKTDIYILNYMSSSEAPDILVIFKSKLNPTNRFSKNTQIPNSTKFPRVEAKLFHADGRTDRQDEANSSFSQFCESA
jgi:hypothetical protein